MTAPRPFVTAQRTNRPPTPPIRISRPLIRLMLLPELRNRGNGRRVGRAECCAAHAGLLPDHYGDLPACALVFTAIGIASPTFARGSFSFDGDWSVVIETRGGACAPTLRYPIAISNGIVTNAGDTPAAVSGRVPPAGTVRVTVQSGGSWLPALAISAQPAAPAFGEAKARVASA